MEILEGCVRPYAWGSRTRLAALRGHPVPSAHPEAELWFGAHRDEPSRLAGRAETLTTVIAEDPVGTFGPVRARRWEGRLPFLLKVLAADEPLSLQAHPSAEQALTGYEREEAAGVPRTAGERNYPDPLPKPELLYALEEFHALAGFREPHGTLALLGELAVPALTHHVELLAAQPDADGLRALFTTWITLPQRAVDDLVPAVLDACVHHVAARPGSEHGPAVRTVLDLGERYPGDAGVLAALLLNRVRLEAGQCLYQPAGSPHAYLAGSGVELMANSDNVLRAGLTPKHVDVPELLRVLDFRAGPAPLLTPVCDGPRAEYRVPAEYFSLVRFAFDAADPGPAPLGVDGPRIALCVAGAVTLRSARGQERPLTAGTAMWLPACDGEVELALSSEAGDVPALAFVAADGLR